MAPSRDDTAGYGPRPRKQRKQRPYYSCSECRRLKMKCDRQEPCSNCVRRRRVEFCIPTSTPSDTSSSRRNSARASQAESQHGQTMSPAPSRPMLDQPPHQAQRYRQEAQLVETPLQSPGCSALQDIQHLHPQLPGGLDHAQPHNPPSQSSLPGGHHELDTLAILAQSLGGMPEHAAPVASLHSPASAAASHRTDPSFSMPSVTAAASSTNCELPPGDKDDSQSGSYGTLMLSRRGRSKYLGPTAGSEWLKESEMQTTSDTPFVSRAPSPDPPALMPPSASSSTAFPFSAAPAGISTRQLLSCLPPRDEAWILVESYYRYCAWQHDVAPKPLFEKTFDRVYRRVDRQHPSSAPIDPQEIALVFIIMAMGTFYNIEMPYCDASAEEWLHLAERALVKGDFLSNNTVAGLQTLHLMAHLHLLLDKGRHGDRAWPIWGLVMRLAQAMGMHRDGDRWNLPEDVAEERRKVFWECNAADIFQAHCFSRPCAINPDHCDTAFPSEPPLPDGGKGYSIIRLELSQLSSEILNMAMKVQRPSYANVMELDLRLRDFENSIPFALRCRAALLAMPSRYPQVEHAIKASPEPSPRSVTLSFRQTNLALNVAETVINLHRPYYAKALYLDNTESVYRPSFYTVVERCAILISLVTDIHARFPAVSTRQWNFWYHVFNAALCLGTLVLRDPRNVLAGFVVTQIDTAISLFTSLLQHGASTARYKSNLQWLMNLRARAQAKMTGVAWPVPAPQVAPAQDDNSHGGGDDSDPSAPLGTAMAVDGQQETAGSNDDGKGGDGGDGHAGAGAGAVAVAADGENDLELLGWRTRLIERAGQQKTIRTIPLMHTPTGSHVSAVFPTPSMPQGGDDGDQRQGKYHYHHQPQHHPPQHYHHPIPGQLGTSNASFSGGSFPTMPLDSATDILLDFWDPMWVQDVFGPTPDDSDMRRV